MIAQDYLAQKHKESVTRMFKTVLSILEDMKADHDFHYQKLYENLPSEYHPIVNTANHFDDKKAQWIRKKVLDVGNDCLREFKSEMENCTVSFIFKQ